MTCERARLSSFRRATYISSGDKSAKIPEIYARPGSTAAIISACSLGKKRDGKKRTTRRRTRRRTRLEEGAPRKAGRIRLPQNTVDGIKPVVTGWEANVRSSSNQLRDRGMQHSINPSKAPLLRGDVMDIAMIATARFTSVRANCRRVKTLDPLVRLIYGIDGIVASRDEF